jgi:hypothetical protein
VHDQGRHRLFEAKQLPAGAAAMVEKQKRERATANGPRR